MTRPPEPPRAAGYVVALAALAVLLTWAGLVALLALVAAACRALGVW